MCYLVPSNEICIRVLIVALIAVRTSTPLPPVRWIGNLWSFIVAEVSGKTPQGTTNHLQKVMRVTYRIRFRADRSSVFLCLFDYTPFMYQLVGGVPEEDDRLIGESRVIFSRLL